MTSETRAVVTKTDILAATDHFEFSAYVDEHWWRDDGHDHYRLTAALSRDIRNSTPVLQPPKNTLADVLGLTPGEYLYSSQYWVRWHESPIIKAIREKNWSLRRCHMEMVEMLRALIALDPETLKEFDVVDITEVSVKVELGERWAAAVIREELARLPANETEGNMLRYGIMLGMHLVGVGEFRGVLDRVLGGLGVHDGMTRPEYPPGGSRSGRINAECDARAEKAKRDK